MNVEDLKSHATEVAGLMKILANSHRLLILCELHKGECNVGQLQRAVGLSQSALSQHLARLRAENLVAVRRDAQTIHYSLTDPNVRDVMALLYRLYCEPRFTPSSPKDQTDDN